jgi:hypothetical protein
MKHECRIVPIDANLVSKCPDLAQSINAFITANLSGAPGTDKAWAVYFDYGDSQRIVAFAGCNLGSRFADIPVFYVEPGTDRQSKWEAAKASEVLAFRLSSFVADSLGFGTQVLIRIEPRQEYIWDAFVTRMGVVKAERFILEV